MGKRETLGFILIGVVLIVWMWLNAPPPPKQSGVTQSDTTGTPALRHEPVAKESPGSGKSASTTQVDSLGTFFSHLAKGTEKVLTITTDLYTAEVTTRGAELQKWELTNYKTWDGHHVQMVDPDYGGDLGMLFLSKDGKEIKTSSLYFDADYRSGEKVHLQELQSHTVTFVLPVGQGRRIVKRLTFHNGTYACDVEIELQNLADVISNFEYHITWESGVRFAEHNSVNEATYARAYAFSGGELIEIDAESFEWPAHQDINGSTDWVASRNKYFAVAMLPEQNTSQGAVLEGQRMHKPDQGESKLYALSLKMPFKGTSLEGSAMKLFLGPLEFDVVSSYERGLDQIMSLGAAWIIRPISEYIMIPLFNLLHIFIPNFGFVIIVFSIIIKVVLHPLSKTSMKSMKKMQALQPMMTEIREKHKDDPQKMNQSIMNLYKDYGVNPASGCLPLLLQMPILFALYAVFQASIELRQAGFMFWITDLSIPDVAFTLPFTIPLLGTSEMSGLALAMGLTMFIQQKMTVTDPRQKAMVWMMPIMMTLLFNSLPSGLNLYYFVFNLLSIGQQVWMNKTQPDEPLRKVDPQKKSGGWMSRISKDLPKMRR